MQASKFQPFPILKTERLRLRALVELDASFIYKLRTSPFNNQYIDLPIPSKKEDCITYIHSIQNGVLSNRHIYWAIDDKASQTILGTICLWKFNSELRRAELGYELHPSAQGQGYMSEALVAVMSYAKTTLGLVKLEAFTHESNAASVTLLEKHQFSLRGYKAVTHSRTGTGYNYAIYARDFD